VGRLASESVRLRASSPIRARLRQKRVVDDAAAKTPSNFAAELAPRAARLLTEGYSTPACGLCHRSRSVHGCVDHSESSSEALLAGDLRAGTTRHPRISHQAACDGQSQASKAAIFLRGGSSGTRARRIECLASLRTEMSAASDEGRTRVASLHSRESCGLAVGAGRSSVCHDSLLPLARARIGDDARRRRDFAGQAVHGVQSLPSRLGNDGGAPAPAVTISTVRPSSVQRGL